MIEKKVFWSSLEYKHTHESPKYPELEGGFVYAFLYAVDVLETVNQINKIFEKNYMKILEVEFVKPYEEDTSWDSEENKQHYASLYQESLNSQDVIFDTFYEYEELDD